MRSASDSTRCDGGSRVQGSWHHLELSRRSMRLITCLQESCRAGIAECNRSCPVVHLANLFWTWLCGVILLHVFVHSGSVLLDRSPVGRHDVAEAFGHGPAPVKLCASGWMASVLLGAPSLCLFVCVCVSRFGRVFLTAGAL